MVSRKIRKDMDIEIYKTLLSTKRHRISTNDPREAIVETESDRGRIIFSNAFRRMHQKAQVFPLESNAAVRTRLTHSLEVAHTGRYLAQQVLLRVRKKVKNFREKWLGENEQAFINIVESACLIHDIGNPPFGHFGEAAIRDWFSRNSERLFKIQIKRKNFQESALRKYKRNEFKDFLTFDGNAQGLRIVSLLQGDDGKTGLNLTYGHIAAYMKYGALPQHTSKFKPSARYKKPGFFNTEKELIKATWSDIRLKLGNRHPLSYIMEAADDIAYCLSDIEDGIEKGMLSEEQFFDAIKHTWASLSKSADKSDRDFLDELLSKANKSSAVGRYILFKTSLINHLVNYAADIYCEKHEQVIRGTLDGLIRKPSKEHLMLKAVRLVVGKMVFQSAAAESIELAGYNTINGLLNQFSCLLECNKEELEALVLNDEETIHGHLDYERRLFNRISLKSRKAYSEALNQKKLNRCEEWHLRAHMLVDHISGMTDDFALETYQLLAGIRVEA